MFTEDSSFFPSNFSDNGKVTNIPIRPIPTLPVESKPNPSPTYKPSIAEFFANNPNIGHVRPVKKEQAFIITNDVEGKYIGHIKPIRLPQRKFKKGERVMGRREEVNLPASMLSQVKLKPSGLIVDSFYIPHGYFEPDNKVATIDIVADTSNHNYVFTKDFKALRNDLGSENRTTQYLPPRPFKKGETVYGVEKKDSSGNYRIMVGIFDVTDGVKPIEKASPSELQAMSKPTETKSTIFTPKNIAIGLLALGIGYLVFKPKFK